MYGSTTKGDVIERFDCILVYGSTTKGNVIERFDCIISEMPQYSYQKHTC